MGPRRIQPDPLHDHTAIQPLVSYQFGTSTGPTTAGRAHETFAASLFDPQDGGDEAMDDDIDMELPDLMEVDLEDSDDEEDTGAAPPSIKVVAHKVPAKRYTNSVSTATVSSYPFANTQSG